MVLLARAGTNAFRFSVCSVQSQLRLSTSCLGPVTKRQVDVFKGGVRSGRGSLRGLASGSGEPVRAGRLGAGVELRPYQTVVPEAKRLVVIGDVHGDIGEICFLFSGFKLAVDGWQMYGPCAAESKIAVPCIVLPVSLSGSDSIAVGMLYLCVHGMS